MRNIRVIDWFSRRFALPFLRTPSPLSFSLSLFAHIVVCHYMTSAKILLFFQFQMAERVSQHAFSVRLCGRTAWEGHEKANAKQKEGKDESNRCDVCVISRLQYKTFTIVMSDRWTPFLRPSFDYWGVVMPLSRSLADESTKHRMEQWGNCVFRWFWQMTAISVAQK